MMTWLLPDEVRDEMLSDLGMPIEVWDSLAIIHRIATHMMWSQPRSARLL